MSLLPILDVIAPVVNKVLDMIPDPNARQRAELQMQSELLQAITEHDKAQAETNTAEATNSNLFVAGWRPAIGWVCATAFAWNYVGFPIAEWLLVVLNVHTVPLKPVMDGNLMELTLGMLGLGAMRTFDKIKGVASK